MKNVVIIDALNMFLRSYVVSPHMDKKGIPVGGTIGFIKSLQKVIRDFSADEVIVAWDGLDGSRRKRSLNPEYKAGRKAVRFNRRSIELSDDQEQINKGYQQLRLIEYLNSIPVMQLIADYTEADDIIAHIVQSSRYGGYKKTIVSSDKDFFQLCNSETQIYRPTQRKIMTLESVIKEFSIHPKNFALARAMAGDKSDNLPGVRGVGLKTIAKKFPYLIRENVYNADDIIRDCAMVGKKLKMHHTIQASTQLIKDNYQIMQLYYPNIKTSNRVDIDKALYEFEPEFDKLTFDKMLSDDDAMHLNFLDMRYAFSKMIK